MGGLSGEGIVHFGRGGVYGDAAADVLLIGTCRCDLIRPLLVCGCWISRPPLHIYIRRQVLNSAVIPNRDYSFGAAWARAQRPAPWVNKSRFL